MHIHQFIVFPMKNNVCRLVACSILALALLAAATPASAKSDPDKAFREFWAG